MYITSVICAVVAFCNNISIFYKNAANWDFLLFKRNFGLSIRFTEQ